MENYKEHIAKSTFTVLIIGLAGTLLGYGLRIYLARNLSVLDFGMFYSVLAFLYFFGVFKDFGLGQAVTKFISEFQSKKEFANLKSIIYYSFISQFFVGLIISVTLFFLSDIIAVNFFHDASAKIIVQIMSIEFLIGFVVLKSVLQGLNKIKSYALIEPVRLLIIWFLILSFSLSLGASGVALSYLISGAVINAALVFYVFKRYRTYDTESVRPRVAKKLLKFSLTVFAGVFAATVIASIDSLMIAFFLSLNDVALYQVAMPTAQFLLVFSSAIGIVLLPSVSAIWNSDKRYALDSGISLLLKFLFIFIIPFAIILITFPEITLNLVFGPSYINAAPLLQILTVSAIFQSIFSIMYISLLGIGKPEITTRIIIFIAAINFTLNLLLINLIGIIGAAISSMISYLLAITMSYKSLGKYIKIGFSISEMVKVFVGGIIATIIIFFVKNTLVTESILEAIISLIIGFTVYLVFILLSKVVKKSDIKMLSEINIKVSGRILKFLFKVVK